MKCPQCNGEFPWSWKRYVTSPFGNTTCPLCGTKLVGSHRRIYWPLVILGVCVVAGTLTVLGYVKYGLAGALAAGLIGGLAVALPYDRFLESKFLVFTVREGQIPDEAGGGDVQQS